MIKKYRLPYKGMSGIARERLNQFLAENQHIAFWRDGDDLMVTANLKFNSTTDTWREV